jgi:hypothetical protein
VARPMKLSCRRRVCDTREDGEEDAHVDEIPGGDTHDF